MAGIRVLNSVGATVTIDGVERESVTVDAGTTVHWKVAKTGYVTQEGDYTVLEDTVLPVVLKREEYEITFVVSPADASFGARVINDSSEAESLGDGVYRVTAKYGDTISYAAVKSGYTMKSGTIKATQSETIYVTLEEEVVEDPDRTIVFEVSPQEAKLTVNGEEMRDRGTYPMIAHDGDVLEWSCECDGYIQQSGTHTVNGDAEINIVLEAYYIYFDPDYLIWDSYEHTDDSAYVYTNMDFTVESDSEWLSCYKDGKDVDLRCSDNFGSERTGTVTATGVEWPLTAKLTITQAAVVNPDRTIRFVVSPDNATLTVNGTNVTLSGGTYTMTAKDGDEISWSCRRDGYVSQSGSLTVDGDETVTVTLEAGLESPYIYFYDDPSATEKSITVGYAQNPGAVALGVNETCDLLGIGANNWGTQETGKLHVQVGSRDMTDDTDSVPLTNTGLLPSVLIWCNEPTGQLADSERDVYIVADSDLGAYGGNRLTVHVTINDNEGNVNSGGNPEPYSDDGEENG